jgi:glycosyltransferase involved in cell wall biosynthesis
MKVNLVAAVNPSGPAASGVRSYVFTLARELTSRGVEVAVIGYGPNSAKHEVFDFVSVGNRMGSASEFIVALALFLKRTDRLQGLVHANRPDDLVPFHLESPQVPVVLTLHGVHGVHVRARRGPVPAAAYRLAERYSLVRARAILCVSPDTLSYFRDVYPFLSDRLRMVPSGVDMDFFRIRSRAEARAMFHFPEEHKLVAFIGRFEPEKNPMQVAHDFLAVNKQHSDSSLVMVGAGSLTEDIRRLASSNPGRIQVLPPMDQDRLAWLLNAADVLVVASYHEGLPTVALEGLASGTPVVGTPVGILPQIVKSGVNGFLADRPLQLASLLERALYEVDWVEEACRSSVREFGWDRIVPAILEVYCEVWQ